MFEIFTLGVIQEISTLCQLHGRLFGIGGIGNPLDSVVPLSPKLIASQHASCGSSSVILSRAWHSVKSESEFANAVSLLRSHLCVKPTDSESVDFISTVSSIASSRRST